MSYIKSVTSSLTWVICAWLSDLFRRLWVACALDSQLSGQLAVLLRCLVQREACVLTECALDYLLEMQGIAPFLHLSSPAVSAVCSRHYHCASV